MPRPLSTHERGPVSILQEAGWALGPLWMGLENPTPTYFHAPGCQQQCVTILTTISLFVCVCLST